MADGSDDERRDDLSIDGDIFVVLVNAEGQHSLWPAAKAVPEGWSTVHAPASKADCLAYVEANWTDMRPVSLREAMARDGSMRAEPPHGG
jgi:MbtH protein